VGDEAAKQLERLSNLRDLTLSRTLVTDAGLRHVSPSVRFLRLADTKITDAGAGAIRRLNDLEYLDLDRTQISDSGLLALVNLPRLRHVSVYGTRVTAAGVAGFLRTSPTTRKVDSNFGVPPEGEQR
jgi:hypothetical protein